MQPYYDLVERILGKDRGSHGHHEARLCRAAADKRREFHNTIEAEMMEGGDFEDVRDIASKATTQVAKLALVLHVAANPDVLDSPSSQISLDTWLAAMELGTFYLDEAVRSQRRAGEDSRLEPARRVLRWIRSEQLEDLTARDLSQFGPRPRLKAEEAHALLALLADHGYLVETLSEVRRKPIYLVNPSLHSGGAR